MAQPKNPAPNLWIVDQPGFSTGIARIGTRMTVGRIATQRMTGTLTRSLAAPRRNESRPFSLSPLSGVNLKKFAV